jgi:hypothetical protein
MVYCSLQKVTPHYIKLYIKERGIRPISKNEQLGIKKRVSFASKNSGGNI